MKRLLTIQNHKHFYDLVTHAAVGCFHSFFGEFVSCAAGAKHCGMSLHVSISTVAIYSPESRVRRFPEMTGFSIRSGHIIRFQRLWFETDGLPCSWTNSVVTRPASTCDPLRLICVCERVCVSIGVHVCECVFPLVCMCASVFPFVRMCASVFPFVCMCASVCFHLCACVHVWSLRKAL